MLPTRENLTLSAAARYVATRCRDSVAAARAAIAGALMDVALIATGRRGIYARSDITGFDWRRAAIDWDASSAMVRGRYVHPSWTEIELSRFQIDRWLRIAEPRRVESPGLGGASLGSQHTGGTAIAVPNKNAAPRDPEKEAKLRSRIQAVLTAAQRFCTKRGKPMELAVLAEALEGKGGYSAGSIRLILNGTYKPAKSRGYPSFKWKDPKSG
jgi:hypothetical protein